MFFWLSEAKKDFFFHLLSGLLSGLQILIGNVISVNTQQA